MSNIGTIFNVSVFGESHGPAIGAVINGVPQGIKLNMEDIKKEMVRRAPSGGEWSTKRKETDAFEIISGVLDETTTGAPLTMIIRNTDARSKDYENLRVRPRPGHADYTAYVKYQDEHDIRGGGHFSARLTAPIVFAGAVAKQVLAKEKIDIVAHIAAIKECEDTRLNEFALPLLSIKEKLFPVIDDTVGEKMREIIDQARREKDSVGGVIECGIFGLKPGIGGPLFDGLEGALAKGVYGIPAVKGISFGAGFDYTNMFGSEANDAYMIEDAQVRTKTNHCGGILGGISNGMPLIFRIAFKPTPSIGKPQQTVDIDKNEETIIEIKGRHDPCVLPRAVPVVEAVSAIIILDEILKTRKEI